MENMTFQFCGECGSYICPGAEHVTQVDGQTTVVCPDCAGREDGCESIADEFSRKYSLGD